MPSYVPSRRPAVRQLALSALFLALGFVLPFITGQLQSLGQALLPMHLPVLLAGFICGPWWGLAVGLLTPLLRSLLLGMPPLYPTALAMMLELGTYALVAGLIYRARVSKRPEGSLAAVLAALVPAMLSGRVVWGLATWFLLGLRQQSFTLPAFVAGAFMNSIPGIVLQLILVPLILRALAKAGLRYSQS
ncbi:MAG: ECF transporter S component [Oscillospiraceae bacterium]|nr:ECF transporter S component [Oscillospiraceae bacterium]MDD4369090.1 ECF transporter S component [Oscillospiraceae bacterium]